MSVSSSGSQISINYNGEEMDLEQMLDETVRGIQHYLNDLQMVLRNIAQSDDRGDDFEEVVEMTDKVEDDVNGMIFLFEDLKDVASQIRGKTPADKKEWYTQHKLERKNKKAQMKAEHKANTSVKVTKMDTVTE